MARSIGAIVAGFLLIAILSFGTGAIVESMNPDAFTARGVTEDVTMLLLAILYVGVYAIAGCYLTGRLAPNRPLRHAMILGILGLIFNVMGTIAMWDTAPVWYHVVSLLLVLPYAYIGGKLAESHRQRSSAVAPA